MKLGRMGKVEESTREGGVEGWKRGRAVNEGGEEEGGERGGRRRGGM